MIAYAEPDDEPLDPAAERVRKKMVRLLLVSGGIMALGFIAVLAALVYKLGLFGAGEPAPADGRTPVDAAIAVPAGARLVATALDGGRALLQVEAADGVSSLILVDLASGTVLGRYTLEPE